INNPNDLNGNSDTEDEVVEKEKDVETEESTELEEDNEETEENSTPELTVIEEGSGSSPSSIFELKNAGEEIIVTFDTGTRTWLDVESDQQSLFSSTLEPEN